MAIKPLNISDEVRYFNPNTGVKITKFVEGAHNADAHNEADIELCMKAARKVHTSNIQVSHRFDFKERIDYYEKIAEERKGIFYHDYREVRSKMDELLRMLDKMEKPLALTHIDLIPDNVLIRGDEFFLLDWEYAGMCDPLADIAMFTLYAYYNEAELEHIISVYFGRKATTEERIRIYSYVSLAGFLWALWTCYKQALGVNFGEYGLKMYRYAKDYYKKVKELL